MDIKKSKALIFGAGSIGERHIKNLLELGCEHIFVFRQRNLPLRNVENKDITILTELTSTSSLKPDFAIICSPTSQHLEQTIFCLENKIPVLVEKPLHHELSGFDQIKDIVKKTGTLLQVGYMMRYHPLLKKIKKGLEENRWGKTIYIRSYWGEYLPDWHPWEDYRNSYAAKKNLGGGAALTLSHDIDTVHWLANSTPTKTNTLKSYASNLEVDVDSAADIQINYENGIMAHVHVNFFQKIARREYQIECENASIFLNFFTNELSIKTVESIETINDKNFDRNDLFLDQTIDFISNLSMINPIEFSLKQIENSEFIIKTCLDER